MEGGEAGHREVGSSSVEQNNLLWLKKRNTGSYLWKKEAVFFHDFSLIASPTTRACA